MCIRARVCACVNLSRNLLAFLRLLIVANCYIGFTFLHLPIIFSALSYEYFPHLSFLVFFSFLFCTLYRRQDQPTWHPATSVTVKICYVDSSSKRNGIALLYTEALFLGCCCCRRRCFHIDIFNWSLPDRFSVSPQYAVFRSVHFVCNEVERNTTY